MRHPDVAYLIHLNTYISESEVGVEKKLISQKLRPSKRAELWDGVGKY